MKVVKDLEYFSLGCGLLFITYLLGMLVFIIPFAVYNAIPCLLAGIVVTPLIVIGEVGLLALLYNLIKPIIYLFKRSLNNSEEE